MYYIYINNFTNSLVHKNKGEKGDNGETGKTGPRGNYLINK